MSYFSKTDPIPFSKPILWEFCNDKPRWSAHKGEGVGLEETAYKP